MEETSITVTLTGSEAVVLFEWLCRFNASGHGEFEDQAEQRVLWNLEATLETKLVSPLSKNYDNTLSAARAQVRDSEE